MNASDPARREHFAHEADMGIRGIGASREEAFVQAALALMDIIVDVDTVAPKERIDIHLVNPDQELLLADWLNAIIYQMSVSRMVFARFEVEIAGDCLIGRMWGEKVDVARHQPAVEAKGATYTALYVGTEADGRWVAQCVIDV